MRMHAPRKETCRVVDIEDSCHIDRLFVLLITVLANASDPTVCRTFKQCASP